jgi:hypothetical protein
MRKMGTRLLRQVTLAVLLLVVGLVSAGPAAAATKTIRYGPYTIPAASEGNGGMGELKDYIQSGVMVPCSNCYITSMQANFITASGQTANVYNGLMMHHMVLFNQGRTDATCAGTLLGSLGQRFFASGNERTPIALPPGYGYPVGRFENWTLLYHLMNMNSKPRKVYITVTFGYRSDTTGFKAVTPVWLDINQCGTSEFTIPTGYSDHRWTWTVNVPGEIVAIGGHIHTEGHGVLIEANDFTTKTHICTSLPTYGGTPEYISNMEISMNGATLPEGSPFISGMSTCVGTPVATIARGDRVRIDALYQNPGPPYTGAMGIMLAAIANP